jgi:SAM-dependent MidA family methyltransferase
MLRKRSSSPAEFAPGGRTDFVDYIKAQSYRGVFVVTVLSRIQNEIRDKGPMTFARFMELALYAPGGYYEKQRQIGRAGDFYTSVCVGPLFGELLARQLATWLNDSGCCEIIEVGAHDGRLARDILNWLSVNDRPLFERLQYIIVETSEERMSWQRATLADFQNRVLWLHDLPPNFGGVIFSNELLDAMPVHRLFWDQPRRQWMEWLVRTEGDKLFWARGELSAACRPLIPSFTAQIADVLPNGFTIDVSPSAISWWRKAARCLKQGRLVAIDYGLLEQEFFRPDRVNGTARGYYKHSLADDLLANPGEQDLTAHVNWTAIQRSGEEAGLKTEIFCSQEEFLMHIVKQIPEGQWSGESIRQLKTLTHPGFLGRAFRVLVQARD